MTGLCVIFAVIYEILGHGVYSWRIRLLFLAPLVMFLLFALLKRRDILPFLPAITLLRLLAASEIARNAFIGIVEVYGTRTSKDVVFGIISIILAIATVVAAAVCTIRHRRSVN